MMHFSAPCTDTYLSVIANLAFWFFAFVGFLRIARVCLVAIGDALFSS